MANAIVLEVLEFVRPIRLQVERIVARRRRSATRSRWPKATCPAGSVQVDGRAPRRDLPPIQGDPHQLRQLFTNLLTNAFEALERARRRCRSSRRDAAPEEEPCRRRRARARSDGAGRASPTTGPAMPPDVVDRIFSPFFTTKPQGSGLGLAIVRKIVDAHDGRIDVSARPGQAARRFRVTLPVNGSHELFK